MSEFFRASAVRCAVAVACCVSVAGCGRAAYERRMLTGMQAMRAGGTQFELPGTPIKVTLPTGVLNESYFNEQAAEPGTQEPIKEDRLYPPFLRIPGLRAMFQGQRPDPDNNNAQVVYYCYLAATAVGELGPDGTPYDQWVPAQLAAVLNTQAAWETVSCPAPSGPAENWQRISVTAPQDFLGAAGAPPANLPGVFQLYMREIGEWRVVIAWRVPEKISKGVLDLVPAMAGSVTVAKAEAPAGGGGN